MIYCKETREGETNKCKFWNDDNVLNDLFLKYFLSFYFIFFLNSIRLSTCKEWKWKHKVVCKKSKENYLNKKSDVYVINYINK